MAVFKENTKKGEFLVETGSKKTLNSKRFESKYLSSLDDNQRSQMAWELFIDYHLSHGTKIEQLRLDRTVIMFGRRESKISNRRRPRSRKIR